MRGLRCRGPAPLGEGGQTLIMLTVWLVVLLLVAGLVLDLCRMQVLRHELRSACEAGALAAALCAERQEEGHWDPVYEWVPDPETGEPKRVKVGEEWVVDREWAEITDPARAREEGHRVAMANALGLFPYARVERLDVEGLSGENPEVSVSITARCATLLLGPVLGGFKDVTVRVSASSKAALAGRR